jgi:undecaprenyl-diphosphatase
VVALAPGVSRTGATLTALRARGVDREEALRTSLLMSLPVTLGAAGLTAVRGRELPAAVPTAVAGVTAYVAARRVRATKGFVSGSVLYRLAVAATVAVRLRRERS